MWHLPLLYVSPVRSGRRPLPQRTGVDGLGSAHRAAAPAGSRGAPDVHWVGRSDRSEDLEERWRRGKQDHIKRPRCIRNINSSSFFFALKLEVS